MWKDLVITYCRGWRGKGTDHDQNWKLKRVSPNQLDYAAGTNNIRMFVVCHNRGWISIHIYYRSAAALSLAALTLGPSWCNSLYLESCPQAWQEKSAEGMLALKVSASQWHQSLPPIFCWAGHKVNSDINGMGKYYQRHCRKANWKTNSLPHSKELSLYYRAYGDSVNDLKQKCT